MLVLGLIRLFFCAAFAAKEDGEDNYGCDESTTTYARAYACFCCH